MARKVLLDVDPGIADAMAICLALKDPRLEVVAVTATGGNVQPNQATRNVEAIIEQLDPSHWPRIGMADLEQPLRADGRELWGQDGLCGAQFRVAELHHRHLSAKVIADEIRTFPGEITILACGPLSNLAAVFQREPDLATQVGHLIIVGGTLAGSGNVTAAAEFNIFCDAEAARTVFRSPVTKTLLPLEVSSQVMLQYDLLDQLPDESTGAGLVLRDIMPRAFRAYRQRLGIEGIYLPEVVALVAALHPELLTTEPLACDVEIAGELTYGATVLDRRQASEEQANMDVVVDLDVAGTLDCLMQCLACGAKPAS